VADIGRFIGKEYEFACEPYHSGTMVVEEIIPLREVYGYTTGDKFWLYTVKGRTIKASTKNRLFSAVSYTDYSGQEIELHRITERELEGNFLRYVYPV
jgi:hypothetical protein